MDQTNTIQKTDENKLTWTDIYESISINTKGEYTADDLKVMRNNVAKNTTPAEFKYFLNVSRGSGLNPFNKEIWCYKDYQDNLLVLAARDGFLKKAQSNPAFNGIRSSEVKANDDFSMDIPNNKINHTIKDPKNRGDIVGAYAIVFRKDGEPTATFVEFSRYQKKFTDKKTGKVKQTPWVTHPEDMIKKVAECKALKLAFGFGALQIEEDFDIREGKVYPLTEKIEKLEAKRILTDEQFKKFIAQSDEYIHKFMDKVEFTEDQKTKLEERLK